MRAAQGFQAHLRQAPVQDLPLLHELLHGAGHVFDRHRRIHPVLVQQVDAVGAQALQHAFDRLLDVGRAAVQAGQALARLEVDVPAELGGDRDLVAERGHALAEDAFDFMRAVGFGGVEKVTPRSKAVRMMLCISGRLGIVVW
jgi:hypothetical protein